MKSMLMSSLRWDLNSILQKVFIYILVDFITTFVNWLNKCKLFLLIYIKFI